MPETAWTIRKSHYIMKDRWLGLRADDCVTPSGHVLDPYYVLETADIALVLGIDAADHVILVRQYRHAYGSPSLELPGGAIDPGDTDILAAAEREMREETATPLPMPNAWSPSTRIRPATPTACISSARA